MLLKRKPRRVARPCPHCGKGMDPQTTKCAACGRRVRIETAVPARESIDIVLPPARDPSRHEW